MNEDDYPEFIFYTSKFGISADEVEETNPYMFGRELAHWLSGQLLQRGYDAEVIPEDWGWCVVCQRKPFSLFVSCVSALDKNLVERCKDSSSDADILWRAVPVAEKSILRRLGDKIDVDRGLEKLRNDVEAILDSEPSIRFATEEQIEEWDSAVVELVDEVMNDDYQPKPVSRWISVSVGLLLLPILLISAVGAVSLLYDNPVGYEIIRPVVGIVLLLLIVLVGSAVVRMILGKQAAHGGLFPPPVLRAFAVVFFVLPIGGLFTGWYLEHPVLGTLQAIAYFAMAAALWRLARYRKEKLERQ